MASRSVGRALVVGLALTLTIVVAPLPSGADPPVLPTSGALFGAFAQPDGVATLDRRSALEGFESQVGRKMALERVYYRWDQAWPTADDAWTRDAGRIPYISWNARLLDRSTVRWADIAAGVYDGVIDARAADLVSFAGPVVFSFHHEPENDPDAGSPAEFAAAFRHIREQFQADGVTNATYAWTMMAWTFGIGTAAGYYPGDDVVDVIAADGYNWFGCPGRGFIWRSFTEVFASFHAFGQLHGKQMMIAEWGGREDPAVDGRKATWLDEASTQLKRWPDIVGLLYFNADRGCSRWVDSSPSSLASFRAMATDPYFSPPPSIAITSGPDVATTTRTATLRFTSAGAAGYRCAIDGGTQAACDTGSWSRTNLGVGSHVFEVVGVDGAGGVTTGVARWAWTIVPGSPIDVKDFAYSPKLRYPGQGTAVLFRFKGPSSHSVTDTSGMALFDTGPLPAGTADTVSVIGAGTYPFACTVHPSMSGQLKVNPLVSPSSGSVTTAFTVQWADGSPPDGFVFDVQIKRPGSTWKGLVNDTTAESIAFTPDKGTGTYSFRARTQLAGAASTQWSPAKAISVG
jgi:hypothetical protein